MESTDPLGPVSRLVAHSQRLLAVAITAAVTLRIKVLLREGSQLAQGHGGRCRQWTENAKSLESHV